MACRSNMSDMNKLNKRGNMLPNNKLKKNKLNYCNNFLIHLKSEIIDANIFVWQRYKLYKDIIIPIYRARAKRRKRKGGK